MMPQEHTLEDTSDIRTLLYPWLVWALSSTFLFYKYLLQVSPTVMVSELMGEFNLTGHGMGHLAAFYFYAYLCMQLPVGVLLDRFSPRKLVVAAILVCGSGAFLFATATSFEQAALGRIFVGLGGAFSAVGTMKLITVWFPPEKFALVSGLMMTVGMLGAVAGEAPVSWSVHQYGWRTTLFYAGLMGIALALLVWLFVRDRTLGSEAPVIEEQPSIIGQLIGLIRDPQSWIIALYSGLAFAPVSAFGGLWGVPFLEEAYHVSRHTVASIVSLIFIGFAVGSPIAGWISDKIQRRKPMMYIGTGVATIILTMILKITNLSLAQLSILMFLFGVFVSFFFVSFATIREIHPIAVSGTAIGFINMFNALFGAISEPLVGKLLDYHWTGQMINGVRVFSVETYQSALMALPFGMVIALVLLFFVRETHCHQVD